MAQGWGELRSPTLACHPSCFAGWRCLLERRGCSDIWPRSCARRLPQPSTLRLTATPYTGRPPAMAPKRASWNNGDMPPMAKARGFSVLRRGYRHASLTALPKPLYVLSSVVVSMKARSTVWARVPTNGETLHHYDTTPATHLRRVGGVDSNDPATGACCLVRQAGEEGAPPRITNRLRQVVVLHHVGD